MRRSCRDHKSTLVGVEHKGDFILAGAMLNSPDRRVAVFDRKWKRTGHEGRPHALELIGRDAAGKNEALSAATDRTKQRVEANRFAFRGRNCLVPQFRLSGRHVPESLIAHVVSHSRSASTFIRHSLTGYPGG